MSDLPPPAESPFSRRFRPLAEFVHAMRFLTRLPIPLGRTIDPPPFAQTMRMFSLVGAFISLPISGLLILGSRVHLPVSVAGLLAVAVGLLMTGALHEDGLADMADGFGGGKTRERRLEIMRDSRIGSYGTLALIIAVGLRVACFAELSSLAPWAVIAVLAACQSFSRALVVDMMWATRPARADGLSAYAGQPDRIVAMTAISIGLALTIVAGSVTQFEASLLALALGLASTAVIRALAIRLIGGQTGDICGAAQVCCEVMMMVAFVATIH